jgi:hypothetical protein
MNKADELNRKGLGGLLWHRRSRPGKVAVILAMVAFAVIVLGTSHQSNTSSTSSSDSVLQQALTPAAPSVPSESSGQSNALSTAQDYLNSQGFSRKGLIQQLEFEGYSAADSTYAVDAVGADWDAEAVQVARDYLQTQSFSRSGLVGQLEFDGFTASQAEYGVSVAY